MTRNRSQRQRTAGTRPGEEPGFRCKWFVTGFLGKLRGQWVTGKGGRSGATSQSHLGSLCLLTPLSNTVLGHGGPQVTPEMYWVTSSWFFSLGIQRYSVCHPLHSFIQRARTVIKSQKHSQQPVLPLIPQKDGNKRKCETLCPRNRGLPAGSSPWSWESPCAWGVRLKTRRDYCPPSPFLFTASWLDFPHHPDSTVHFCILFLFNENIKEHIKPQSKI